MTSNDDNGTTEQLRRAFISNLPERIALIGQGWSRLQHNGWDDAGVARLYQRLRELSAAAARYRLIGLGEAADAAEVYLSAFVDDAARPRPESLVRLGALLEALRVAALEQGAPRGGIGPARSRQLVLCVGIDDTLAPGLTAALEGSGLRVRALARVAELVDQLVHEPPDAIIIDTRLLPRLQPLTDALRVVRERRRVQTKLLFLSSSGELGIRLAALRTGADSYFVKPVEPRRVAERTLQLIGPAAGRPFRVLIVEDDPAQADFAANVLRKGGIDSRILTAPMRLMETLAGYVPDLILMDLYMPDADGVELTRIVREHDEFAGIPIVFLSGEQDADRQLKALSGGGDDFLTKPIRPRHLLTTISNRIERLRGIERQVAQRIERDPATGLATRSQFFERLDRMFASGAAQPGGSGVLYIMLEAAPAGGLDAVAPEIAAAIAAHTEPGDLTARINDESFAVLVRRPHRQQLDALSRVLQRAIDPIVAGDDRRPRSVLIGVCPLSEAAGGVPELLERCQPARAPQAPPDADPAPAPDPLAAEIRAALARDRLHLVSQPFVERDGGRLALRALGVRLLGADGQTLGTAQLMPAAAAAGLDRALDQWLIGRALAILQQHHQRPAAAELLLPLPLALFDDPALLDWLRDTLRSRHQVATGLLFELPLDPALRAPKATRQRLDALRELGADALLTGLRPGADALKLARYLPIRIARLSDRLQPSEQPQITTLLKQTRALAIRTVAPPASDPRAPLPAWVAGLDLIPAPLAAAAGARAHREPAQ